MSTYNITDVWECEEREGYVEKYCPGPNQDGGCKSQYDFQTKKYVPKVIMLKEKIFSNERLHQQRCAKCWEERSEILEKENAAVKQENSAIKHENIRLKEALKRVAVQPGLAIQAVQQPTQIKPSQIQQIQQNQQSNLGDDIKDKLVGALKKQIIDNTDLKKEMTLIKDLMRLYSDRNEQLLKQNIELEERLSKASIQQPVKQILEKKTVMNQAAKVEPVKIEAPRIEQSNQLSYSAIAKKANEKSIFEIDWSAEVLPGFITLDQPQIAE
jgi:hypothetical protein